VVKIVSLDEECIGEVLEGLTPLRGLVGTVYIKIDSIDECGWHTPAACLSNSFTGKADRILVVVMEAVVGPCGGSSIVSQENEPEKPGRNQQWLGNLFAQAG
jgi:hypothetical protein